MYLYCDKCNFEIKSWGNPPLWCPRCGYEGPDETDDQASPPRDPALTGD